MGPDLVRDTSEKVDLIRKRLLMAQSRQNGYVDRQQRPLEFEVGDYVFLKVMPKRGVVRFGKWGKLFVTASAAVPEPGDVVLTLFFF